MCGSVEILLDPLLAKFHPSVRPGVPGGSLEYTGIGEETVGGLRILGTRKSSTQF